MFGVILEFDFMVVLVLILMFEECFGVVVDDDEIDGVIFVMVGLLIEFVD